MLVCLDQASCILALLHMLYSLFSMCLCAFLCLSCLVFASFPLCGLFGCDHATMWMRSHLGDVGMFVFFISLLCLAEHVRVSHDSLVCEL